MNNIYTIFRETFLVLLSCIFFTTIADAQNSRYQAPYIMLNSGNVLSTDFNITRQNGDFVVKTQTGDYSLGTVQEMENLDTKFIVLSKVRNNELDHTLYRREISGRIEAYSRYNPEYSNPSYELYFEDSNIPTKVNFSNVWSTVSGHDLARRSAWNGYAKERLGIVMTIFGLATLGYTYYASSEIIRFSESQGRTFTELVVPVSAGLALTGFGIKFYYGSRGSLTKALNLYNNRPAN